MWKMDVNGAEVTSSDPADAENTSEGFKTRLKSLLLTRSETLRSRFEDENFMNDFVRSLMDGTVFAITKELKVIIKNIQCFV